MKKFIIRNYLFLFGIIIGMILTTTVAYAAICVWAKDVGFTSSQEISSTNVQDAIDELVKSKKCPN